MLLPIQTSTLPKALSRLLLVVMLASLVTCKEQPVDEEQMLPVTTPCLLESFVSTSSDGFTTTFTITYDGGLPVTMVQSTSSSNYNQSTTRNFTWDAFGHLTHVEYPSGVIEEMTYTGDEITKRYVHEVAMFADDQTEYTWLNGQLIKVQEYAISAGTGEASKQDFTVLEYKGSIKDYIKRSYFPNATATTQASSIEYTYGINPSPFYALPPAFKMYLRMGYGAVERNFTSTTFSGGTPIMYSYEFNEFHYPVKRIETGETGSSETVFTYKCN